MSTSIPRQHPLRQLFRRSLKRAFEAHPDVYSPPVESHLAEEVLPDFVHNDRIYRLKDVEGRRLEELPKMVELGHAKEGPERSLEVNRYIGDFVLFMCSFFPTVVRRRRWFEPTPMVARVGEILVSFSQPLDYYVAEGRNAYSRAARTAGLFDDEAEQTYEQLGEHFDSYVEVLDLTKRHMRSA